MKPIIERRDNIEEFNGVKINTDLLGLVVTAKYNGEYIPKRTRTLSVRIMTSCDRISTYEEWRRHIRSVSKVFKK